MRRVLPAVIFAALAASTALRSQDADLENKSRRAKEDMAAGRYADAAKLYREMAAALPGNPGPRFNLGLALLKEGRPAEAVTELEAVVKAQADSAPAWFLIGLAHQQLGEPRKAIAPLREAVRLNHADARALLELADAELGAGEPREAIGSFETLAAGHPEMTKAWQGLGLSYAALGEFAAERLDRIAPRSSYWYALLAREKAGLGQRAAALSLYGEALRASPAGLPGLHGARAAIYTETQHADWAAIEQQRETQVPKPDCARHAAACAYRDGKWAAALEEAHTTASAENLYWASLACGKLAGRSFERLAALPESGGLHELLAESDQRMGRRVEAVAEWRKALALEPGDRRVEGRLAESLIRNRDYEEARRVLAPLASAQPENADWQYLLGEALYQQRRAQEALPHLLTAKRLRPDHLATLDVLGRVYLALDRPKDAIGCLEQALPLDDGSLSFALYTAYRRLGKAGEARAALARYRQFQPHGEPSGDPPESVIPPP